MLENEIHIWKIDASEFKNISSIQRQVLPEEAAHANKFSNEELTNNWLIARAGLRNILSEYLDLLPLDIAFKKELHGKPYLQDTELKFNVSHSHNHILVSINWGAEIGVDCEVVRSNIEIESISRNHFSQTEFEYLNNLNPSERLKAFYRCWTRKEAFVKAIGLGMSLPFSDFSVSVAPDEPARIISIKDNLYDVAEWAISDILQAGIPAALAINRTSVTTKFFEFKKFP